MSRLDWWAVFLQWKSVKANLLGKAKHGHHHHPQHHVQKPHGAGERLCHGIALERGGEQVLRVPLAGKLQHTRDLISARCSSLRIT